MDIDMIESHPWFNGPIPSNDEYFQEMSRRKHFSDLKSQQERAQRKSLGRKSKLSSSERRRGANDDEEEKEVDIEIIKPSKDIKIYEEISGFDTGFVICENPDTIIEIIQDYIEKRQEEEDVKYQIDENKYKVKISFESQNFSVDIKIFRINESLNEFYVQFIKMDGCLEDLLTFKTQIEKHIYNEFGYEQDQEGQ